MKPSPSWIFLFLLCAILPGFAVAKQPTVVAVADFTNRFETYKNQQIGRDLATQVQAALQNLEGFQFVERSQLELASRELALPPNMAHATADSLAMGRWVGADLILLGRWTYTPEDGPTIWIEVVDAVEADVLATGIIPAIDKTKSALRFSPETMRNVATQLLHEAIEVQARQSQATLIIAPLSFEFVGRLRHLEPLREEFFRALQEQCDARDEVRLLQFPRARETQDEMELRLDGFTSVTSQRPTLKPVFLWGDLEEVDSENKLPEDVPLRGRVSIRGSSGDLQEIVLLGTVGEAGDLMRDLVTSALSSAESLPAKRITRPEPNPTAAQHLFERAKLLSEEFKIRQRAGEPKGAQIRLGHHIDSLFQLAVFFSPEDPHLRREHLLLRHDLRHPGDRPTFATNWEEHRLWQKFESRFAEHHTPSSRHHSLATTLTLLVGSNLRENPYDWPPELRSQIRTDLEKEIVARMEKAGPETLRKDTHLGHLIFYADGFDSPELRARFLALVWPIFVAHSLKFRDDRPDWERWETLLQETFTAADRSAEIPALLAIRDRNRFTEPHTPEDLRFMVRRLALLPPELDCRPVPIRPGPGPFTINALHFDGTHLWISAEHGDYTSSTNEIWRQRLLLAGRSSKLYRWQPGHPKVESITPDLALPSKICAMASSEDDLWLGTKEHGVFQLNRTTGALIRVWNVSTGLPTDIIYALNWHNNSLMVGGGDLHRGHLFEISEGVEGAVILPVPGWREDIARWRQESTPKSQFGEISIIERAHGRTLVVAGGAQPLLWNDESGEAVNLVDSVLGGNGRHGGSGQNGCVMAVAHDEAGWWLGTDVGLARLAPDGELLQRWNTPRGGYFFYQPNWVPILRHRGILRRNFAITTRLVGAVTALAVDGDYLFVAVSTEVDDYLPSPQEGAHLFVLHIPSNHWVGRVTLPERAIAMAQDETRLWLGLKNHSALLLEFEKSQLTDLPSERHVADSPSLAELNTAINQLTTKEKASYAFFMKEYDLVMEILRDLTLETASLGELFLIAFSNDKNGLAQPEVAREHLEEILRRQPHSFWRAEAERELKALQSSAEEN
jgi:hypothetical protein